MFSRPISSAGTLIFVIIWTLASPSVTANEVGRKVYDAVCFACHAPSNVMVSSPKAGDTREWERRLASSGLDQLTRHATLGIGAMPAKGGCSDCTENQLREAIRFMAMGKQ